jgi:hypothetical protein
MAAKKAKTPATEAAPKAVSSNPGEASTGKREATTTELTNGTIREDF